MERLYSHRLRNNLIRIIIALSSIWLVAYVVINIDFSSREMLFEAMGLAEAGESQGRQLSKLRVLTRSVGYIRNNYVAPNRIRPIPMLLGALKGAQNMIPDLMITPDNEDIGKTASVTVRIGDHERLFDISGITDLYEMNWKLLDIFDFISRYLPLDINEDDVEFAAINGLLALLDEHSIYLPPQAYKEMKLDTQGKFGGLGIVISSRKGLIQIMSVLPDTPAAREGLAPGDQIIQIGEETTMNMKLNDAVTKLRGPPGTKVSILIQRKEWQEPKLFILTRAEIHIQSVLSNTLGNGVGYVHLKHFQEDTRSELEKHLENLKRKGSLQGLILDLRGNPGGLLDQAIQVANVFISEGTIVVTEGEGKRTRQVHEADGDAPYANLPLVVLIDNGSASASEIVAGALKRNNRAILVGNTTFGKGTVQVVYDIEEKGALKLTIAQYLTPGDISIQGVGVAPDIEMVPVKISEKMVLFGNRDEKHLNDSPRRLEPIGKVADDKPFARVKYLAEKGESDNEGEPDEEEEPPVKNEDAFKPDEVIRLAAYLVKSLPRGGRVQIEKVEAPLRMFIQDQEKKIVKEFEKIGINWSQGQNNPDTPIRISWASEKKEFIAGQTVKIKISATNQGQTPVYRVRAVTETDFAPLDHREFVFGRIDPGQTITRETDLQISKDVWDRVDQVKIHIYQEDKEIGEPEKVFVVTRALPRPRIVYSYQIKDTVGNGDGMLSPGEVADLFVDIGNIGNGPSGKILATIRNKNGDAVAVREGRVTIKEGIPIGTTRTARFKIELKKSTEVSTLTFEVGIFDISLREYLSEDIIIPVLQKPKAQFEPQRVNLRTVRDQVKIYSSADEASMILFSLPENSYLRSVGKIGKFFKVDIDEGREGFVKSSDVETSIGVVRFTPLPGAFDTRFTQPGIEVRTEDSQMRGPSGDHVTIKGQIKFASGNGEARRTILIFRGDDKVFFWTKQGPNIEATIPIDVKIPLILGKNDISIFAVEGKQRSAVKRFTVWSETGKQVGGLFIRKE